ncbi:helix-turn-helix transcriptional regulator [Nocardia cyriacigeorgica]|uniref:helix-turn-helix domain-containing protein n=1 Tax=Nocardia cyriacigeorgica TaxID=135487 RepID=UPI001895BBA3|nr:helix-turn-helix transcriptional regulator [Nocardia cyriacigeorgica]MBF6326463.1 helix-turn-helix transcriptional regulator [Nocardia cyriacigeorgica]
MAPLRLDIDRFAQLMRSHGHTSQTAMAKALGLNNATVSRVIRGTAQPGTRFIAAFRNAFPNEQADQYFTC